VHFVQGKYKNKKTSTYNNFVSYSSTMSLSFEKEINVMYALYWFQNFIRRHPLV